MPASVEEPLPHFGQLLLPAGETAAAAGGAAGAGGQGGQEGHGLAPVAKDPPTRGVQEAVIEGLEGHKHI